MKTKREIVENLCDSGAIDFKEALILLDFEVDKPTHQVVTPMSTTSTIPVSTTVRHSTVNPTTVTQKTDVPFTLTNTKVFESNSDLENK